MRFLMTVAWRNLWRHKRRSLITAVAMAFGVGLCMATVAFQDGMFDDIFEVMVEQQLGHVQVHHPEYPSKRTLHDTVGDAEALIAQIDAHPGTGTVSPKLNGFALVGGESKSAGGVLVGIDPARFRDAFPLDERLTQGRYLDPANAGEILLGHKLLDEIDVALGDAVVVVTQAADGSLGNAVYDVVGAFKTGNAQMDRAGAYLHLAELQELLVLPDQVHQLTVLAADPGEIPMYVDGLGAAIGSETIEVQAWWDASPQTAEMMALRDVSALIILAIVFGAAAFGVLNTMMMSVFERTRELGVLRALGLRGGRMVTLVVVESVFLAAVASTIGLIIGGLLDWYVVSVGFDMSGASAEGFSFSGVMLDPVIKGSVRPHTIIYIICAVFVVSVGASLWPAFRAANLEPVEAIRTE